MDGFTLPEMLMVMIIIIVLSAIAFTTVDEFQTTLSVNNAISAIEQDIRLAQRSAMFLSRKENESWIYGIGIDFSHISIDGQYDFIKWCSPFEDFDPQNPVMISEIPAYNPGATLSDTNGGLPVVAPGVGACAAWDVSNVGLVLSANDSQMIKFTPGSGAAKTIVNLKLVDVNLVEVTENFSAGVGGQKVTPTYVLFESVTGRAFIYDAYKGNRLSSGLLNYKGRDPIQFAGSSAIPLRIHIKRKGTSNQTGKMIKVTPVSGRIIVNNAKDEVLN